MLILELNYTLHIDEKHTTQMCKLHLSNDITNIKCLSPIIKLLFFATRMHVFISAFK